MNRENKPIQKNSLITNQTLSHTFRHVFFPMAITTSILAPLNRIKIILQTNRLIAIEKSEKVDRTTQLLGSK